MKIALATLYDSRDALRGSGTWTYMSREIERQGHQLFHLGPVEWDAPFPTRLLKRAARLRGRRHLAYRDPFSGRAIGRQIGARLAQLDFDVLLTNDYAVAGFTPCQRPIVLWTDEMLPWPRKEGRHPWHENLLGATTVLTRGVIRRALRRASLSIFPSQWAFEQARRYPVPGIADKVRLIEFGANLAEPPPPEVAAARRFPKVKGRRSVELLYIGSRDWSLKGGDTVVEAARALRTRGIEVVLHVVGADPPTPLEEGVFVVHGFIDKELEPRRLAHLYEQCDVLIAPTRGEGFGITFVEAAAYGMPSISYQTMGAETAVRDGETGILLPRTAPPARFADAISDWLEDPARYDQLAAGARRFYETVANWETAVERMIAAQERIRSSAPGR